ncbi:MAG TPA: response regulator [Candidatus Sulfopaludibacter sp.]|nr:response regulator [Candidatus Sulfopaludibacter sp.]
MKKILLADDDNSVRQTLGLVFASEQYEVILTATGREAAAKFIADLPDLVLLDLNMPDRDGWDVFELMSDTHPLVPVIVITAMSGQYRRAADLGVDALMEKPLDIPLLLEAVRHYLAEPEAEHIRRLTGPDFKTVLLGECAKESFASASR